MPERAAGSRVFMYIQLQQVLQHLFPSGCTNFHSQFLHILANPWYDQSITDQPFAECVVVAPCGLNQLFFPRTDNVEYLFLHILGILTLSFLKCLLMIFQVLDSEPEKPANTHSSELGLSCSKFRFLQCPNSSDHLLHIL